MTPNIIHGLRIRYSDFLQPLIAENNLKYSVEMPETHSPVLSPAQRWCLEELGEPLGDNCLRAHWAELGGRFYFKDKEVAALFRVCWA